MNVIARTPLIVFWTKHPRAKTPLEAWYRIVSKAVYTNPNEVRAAFGGNVDIVADNRAIFDIGGNKYRLIVRFAYQFKNCQVKFVGTHDEYDAIDPATVEL